MNLLPFLLGLAKSEPGKRIGLVVLGAVAAIFASYVTAKTGVPVGDLVGPTPAKCAPPVICPEVPACTCPAVLRCDCSRADPVRAAPVESDADKDLK
jgi:hypothetical protein